MSPEIGATVIDALGALPKLLSVLERIAGALERLADSADPPPQNIED